MSLSLELIDLLLGGSEGTLVLAIVIGSEVGSVFDLVWQIVLLDPVARIVVGIFVILCISQFLASSIMAITEVAGNREIARCPKIRQGLVHGNVG